VRGVERKASKRDALRVLAAGRGQRGRRRQHLGPAQVRPHEEGTQVHHAQGRTQ